MPRFNTGKVVRVLQTRAGLARLLVEVNGEERKATAFIDVTGPVSPGDRVVVNTTGVDLALGTGGEDFVVWNLELSEAGKLTGGHILKLRYTPWQIDVVAAEAPESPHHAKLEGVVSLGGMCVVACGLHSQIAPVASVIKDARPDLKIAYVMTDGAALPIAQSDLVETMRRRDLIDSTVTYGNAFGGDIECINVFSGLVAAKRVAGADVVITSPGPGIVGTDTPLGHTGMEQGQVLTAAAALEGRPVAALRVSFADSRVRHRVLSHHSTSALRFAAVLPCKVAVPMLEESRLKELMSRLQDAGVEARHEIRMVDASATFDALAKFDLHPTTMGRGVEEDPYFFEAAGAAGVVALQLLTEE